MYEWLLEAEFAMLDFVYGLHNEFLDALRLIGDVPVSAHF